MPALKEHRGVHWVHAISALVLLATGIILYSPSLSVLLGNRSGFRLLHLIASVFFLLPLLFVMKDLHALNGSSVTNAISVIFTHYLVIWFTLTGVMILVNEFWPTYFGESFLFIHGVLTALFVPFFFAHVTKKL